MLQKAPQAITAATEQHVRQKRVLFALTSMPVGGAETLLVNLIRRMDKRLYEPQICCLKEPGPLGEEMAKEIPVHAHLLSSKWDLRVLPRLARLMRREQIDALVTVGAGDKMFWGRIAARIARVPVILSALHSTGWPDGVGRMNRSLTSITDGFIAVAEEHGRFLREHHGFPAEKVFVIPNGIDTDRFIPDPAARAWLREELGISNETRLCGIVAALRPEKNHELFIRAAARIIQISPDCHFVIVGDGPCRGDMEKLVQQLGIDDHVHLLGNRSDIPRIVAGLDLFSLTSQNEANPVSILEALSCEVPVVASDVGSVSATVQPGKTGFLVKPDDEVGFADAWGQLLSNPSLCQQYGTAGRALVRDQWSLDRMVDGYQDLIDLLYDAKW